MISGDSCYLSFPGICITVEENTGKTSTRKTDPTGIEPGPARGEATMLPLDHGGGLKMLSNRTHCDKVTTKGIFY